LARRSISADGIVLLSPADSQALQEDYAGETVPAQRQRLRSANATAESPRARRVPQKNAVEPLLLDEVGIRTGAVTYPIPMSVTAILSFLSDDARVFRYADQESAPASSHCDVPIPAFVYLGREDSLLMHRYDRARSVIKTMFQDVTFAEHDRCDHHFTGFEAEISEEVAGWVRTQDLCAAALMAAQGPA
jgi:hypothetical protein